MRNAWIQYFVAAAAFGLPSAAWTQQGGQTPESGFTGRTVQAIGYVVGGGSTSVDLENTGLMAQVSGKVASGMDATADWLRNTDLDGIKSGIERQVKEHPGRTLLIAAGIGYLLGKALRK